MVLATGFAPALSHLSTLDVAQPNGWIAVHGTRSVREPRLWLVGYGDWTGYASATLIGVGRSARTTVEELGRARGGRRSSDDMTRPGLDPRTHGLHVPHESCGASVAVRREPQFGETFWWETKRQVGRASPA